MTHTYKRIIASSTGPTTLTINVNTEENNNNQAEDTQLQQDEFINPFCTPIREIAESSSRNIDNSNMHTFYQTHDSEYQWTKDHPLEQVCGNPSKPVQTRRQLVTDPEMCMFALTVSTAEPKTIKEAMTNFAWIEAMQEELYQFDILQVWKLVDKPFERTNQLKCLIDNGCLGGWERGLSCGGGRRAIKGVTQTDAFVDPDHPRKFTVKKALYGVETSSNDM
ncbi:hypothetical protein Tco_1065506, partial [Tanacetum coccineum]